jgi:hypothetical protein
MNINEVPESAALLDLKEVSLKTGGRGKGRFDTYNLSQRNTKPVLYRKLEAQNPEMTDVQTPIGAIWTEQFTDVPAQLKRSGVDPRIFVKDGKEIEALKEDDGFILTFHGTFGGERVFNREGRPITVDQAEELQELTGEEPVKYNLWEFRLHEVVLTDGPQRRQKLMESVEEQRMQSEDSMLKSVEKAFAAIAAKMGGDKIKAMDMAASPGDLVKYLSGLDDETRASLFAQAEVKADSKG